MVETANLPKIVFLMAEPTIKRWMDVEISFTWKSTFTEIDSRRRTFNERLFGSEVRKVKLIVGSINNSHR